MNFEDRTPCGDAGVAARRSLNVEQLSRLTALSTTTIRTYLTCKKYQHLLPRGFKRPGGRRWLWWADEVEAWMEQGRPPTAFRTARPRGRPTRRQQLERASRAQVNDSASLESRS